MQAGTHEVEQSATLGAQARDALESILSVVEETCLQTAAITRSVQQMTGSVEDVDMAARQMASLAEQTVQAAAQMHTTSEQLSVVLESIAEVSEQSAASAEEVSASTQQQTAGVAEMSGGAQELASVAARLQEATRLFVLETAAAAEEAPRAARNVVPRRRTEDWSASHDQSGLSTAAS